MPVSLRSAASSVLALACALAFVPGAFGQVNPPEPPRITAGEAVNVEVKIIPFYAVDAKGDPVYDLKPEEVELRVAGATVPTESLDRYATSPSGRAGVQASPLTPTPSRTVFFLFDLAFSSPTGFNTDKRLAARLVQSWPTGDRLFLIVHGTRAGMERRLGPVPPDAEGKKELLAAIEALEPEIKRVELQANPTADFSPPAGKHPEYVMYSAFDGIQGTMRGEYHDAARDLASSLGDFAADLRHISGPKLLMLFSQGVDDKLYFKGDEASGSEESDAMAAWRSPPLVDRFRDPLTAIAESGTVALLVNTDRGKGADAAAVLRHMVKTTGGLYVEGRDPRDLEKRIAGSTTAYYEAAFHPSALLLRKTRAEVEVVIRRPGVRAWAPAAVMTRESYRTLSAFEKRRLVIDLVAGGPEAQHAHGSVRLNVQELGGDVVGRQESGQSLLHFQADWPASLASRRLDLYNVLLAPPEGGNKGKILHFDQREGATAAERGGLETALEEGRGALVWGILAVDPETEQAWVRRLMLRPPGSAAK
jgi:hypothetical protein